MAARRRRRPSAPCRCPRDIAAVAGRRLVLREQSGRFALRDLAAGATTRFGGRSEDGDGRWIRPTTPGPYGVLYQDEAASQANALRASAPRPRRRSRRSATCAWWGPFVGWRSAGMQPANRPAWSGPGPGRLSRFRSLARAWRQPTPRTPSPGRGPEPDHPARVWPPRPPADTRPLCASTLVRSPVRRATARGAGTRPARRRARPGARRPPDEPGPWRRAAGRAMRPPVAR
jgi:hypothetical protein